MVFLPGVDVAAAVERLVHGADYGTAQKTDIDVDDYAALARTWRDSRLLPTRQLVEATILAITAEKQVAEDNRNARLTAFVLANANDATLPELGEIDAISSLAEVKQVLKVYRRKLRLFEVVLQILRNDRRLID